MRKRIAILEHQRLGNASARLGTGRRHMKCAYDLVLLLPERRAMRATLPFDLLGRFKGCLASDGIGICYCFDSESLASLRPHRVAQLIRTPGMIGLPLL